MRKKRWSELFSTVAVLALGLLIATTTAAGALPKRQTGGPVAFVNVRVISMNPGDSKRVRNRQTVVVDKGRIVEIGPKARVAVPPEAEVVNGKGKLYVLPGLNDMHMHNHDLPRVPENFKPEDAYTLFLANGVTTIFDLLGFKQAFKWRKRISRGKVVGPTLYFTSPTINEEDYASNEELEQDVRNWARQGYAYVKSRNMTSPETYRLINELARELSLPVVGHAVRPGFPIQTTLDEGRS